MASSTGISRRRKARHGHPQEAAAPRDLAMQLHSSDPHKTDSNYVSSDEFHSFSSEEEGKGVPCLKPFSPQNRGALAEPISPGIHVKITGPEHSEQYHTIDFDKEVQHSKNVPQSPRRKSMPSSQGENEFRQMDATILDDTPVVPDTPVSTIRKKSRIIHSPSETVPATPTRKKKKGTPAHDAPALLGSTALPTRPSVVASQPLLVEQRPRMLPALKEPNRAVKAMCLRDSEDDRHLVATVTTAEAPIQGSMTKNKAKAVESDKRKKSYPPDNSVRVNQTPPLPTGKPITKPKPVHTGRNDTVDVVPIESKTHMIKERRPSQTRSPQPVAKKRTSMGSTLEPINKPRQPTPQEKRKQPGLTSKSRQTAPPLDSDDDCQIIGVSTSKDDCRIIGASPIVKNESNLLSTRKIKVESSPSKNFKHKDQKRELTSGSGSQRRLTIRTEPKRGLMVKKEAKASKPVSQEADNPEYCDLTLLSSSESSWIDSEDDIDSLLLGLEDPTANNFSKSTGRCNERQTEVATVREAASPNSRLNDRAPKLQTENSRLSSTAPQTSREGSYGLHPAYGHRVPFPEYDSTGRSGRYQPHHREMITGLKSILKEPVWPGGAAKKAKSDKQDGQTGLVCAPGPLDQPFKEGKPEQDADRSGSPKVVGRASRNPVVEHGILLKDETAKKMEGGSVEDLTDDESSESDSDVSDSEDQEAESGIDKDHSQRSVSGITASGAGATEGKVDKHMSAEDTAGSSNASPPTTPRRKHLAPTRPSLHEGVTDIEKRALHTPPTYVTGRAMKPTIDRLKKRIEEGSEPSDRQSRGPRDWATIEAEVRRRGLDTETQMNLFISELAQEYSRILKGVSYGLLSMRMKAIDDLHDECLEAQALETPQSQVVERHEHKRSQLTPMQKMLAHQEECSDDSSTMSDSEAEVAEDGHTTALECDIQLPKLGSGKHHPGLMTPPQSSPRRKQDSVMISPSKKRPRDQDEDINMTEDRLLKTPRRVYSMARIVRAALHKKMGQGVVAKRDMNAALRKLVDFHTKSWKSRLGGYGMHNINDVQNLSGKDKKRAKRQDIWREIVAETMKGS